MDDASKPEVTLREACEYLIDPNTIYLVTKKEDIPKEAKTYLLLRNLETWFNAYHLKYFLESIFKKINYTCNLSEIRILNYEVKSALIYFPDLKEAEC